MRQLLKGQDYLHQMRLIIQLLGVPSEAELAHLGSPSAAEYIRRCPTRSGTPISGTPLSALYPSADPMALGLLSQLLAFDPRKRRTATEALASPYLGELHAMNDAPDAPRLDGTDAFAFEHDESDESDLKALVWRELQHFHPELASAAPPPTFADSPTRVMELELSCDEPSVP